MAEWEASQQQCSQHPGPVSECSDPDKPWYPQMSVCYAAIEAASAQKRWEMLHEKRPWHDGAFRSWTEEPDAGHTVHRDAGNQIWVSPVDHGIGGDFLAPTSRHDGTAEQPNGEDQGNQHQ